MGALPPAWQKCPRKGNLVVDIFLPFKTPLDNKFTNKLSPVDYFTPEMLISSVKSMRLKIGLWIDLTNTNRYYDKQTIERNDIRYLKLPMRGYKCAPSQEDTAAFVNICQNFIRKNPLEIIAVHCTHGFNRTGFLICAYLIEKLDWSADAALSTFALCRPTGIYKDDYIKELFTRYDNVESAPPAPMRPSWRIEEDSSYENYDRRAPTYDSIDNVDEDDDQEGEEQASFSNNGRVKRPSSQFMDGISGVEFVSDTKKLRRLQKKIQEMCDFNGKGFPGSQPVSMSHENLNYLNLAPYQVSWKADGTRYMMLIEAENQIYFFDRDNSVFEIVESCPKFPQRKQPSEHVCETLIDGEMVIDVVAGVSTPRYLIYDIVTFAGEKVGNHNYVMRTSYIDKELIGPRRQAIQNGYIDRSQELFGIRKKDFWNIEHTAKIFSPKFQENMCHEVDGLIFQPVSDPYVAGQCQSILKWKPHTHNSIDFRVRIMRTQNPGCLPETVASLLVGRENIEMAKIKATKEFRENDNKIIECTWDYENHTWKFMRVRTDKSFPNSYATATSVWETIKKPLTKAQLLTFIDKNRYGRSHRQ